MLQKCEAYWPQPKKRTITVLEDEEEQRRKQSVDHEEESEVTNQFGRFHLRVKHCREEDGFTVTDLEIQVNKNKKKLLMVADSQIIFKCLHMTCK